MSPAKESPSSKGSSPRSPESKEAVPPRRTFVSLVTGALGAAVVAIPGLIGARFFLDPIFPRGKASQDEGSPDQADESADGFLLLDISLDALPADGQPVSVTVHDDKDNAWNRLLDVQVGTVWLRKLAPDQVIAFSSVCPHLGCAVDYRDSRGDFFCPCHTSSFNLDGQKTNEIPPRGLDVLQTRLEGKQIWLKYENFRAGTKDKIPVS